MKKSNNTQKKSSVLAIVFYVIAGVMLCLAAYFAYNSIQYVSQYAASYGASVSDMTGEAVKYVMSAVVPYLIYALFAFAAGRIFWVLNSMRNNQLDILSALNGEEEDYEAAALAINGQDDEEEADEEVAEDTEVAEEITEAEESDVAEEVVEDTEEAEAEEAVAEEVTEEEEKEEKSE